MEHLYAPWTVNVSCNLFDSTHVPPSMYWIQSDINNVIWLELQIGYFLYIADSKVFMEIHANTESICP